MRRPVSETSSDDVVASQWLDRLLPAETEVPERRLLVAVLADAVRCLQSGSDRERAEVVAWIRAGYGQARVSFGVMCDGLNIEPAALAARLLAPSGAASIHRMNRVRSRGKSTTVGSERRREARQRPIAQSAALASSA